MKKITFLVVFMLSMNSFAQMSCATAVSVPEGQTTVAGVTGTELPTPDCSGDLEDVTAAMWYTFTATADGGVTITSDLPQNAERDTRLHVYSGSSCATLQCLGYNDDGMENYLSTVTFLATAGTTYYFVWDNYWESNGFDFMITQFPVDCSTSIPFASNFTEDNSFLCYMVEDIDGSGSSWVREFFDFDNDGTNEHFITNYSSFDIPKDDWMFSPSFELTAGMTYNITYTYNAIDLFTPANETLSVVMLNEPSSTASFQQVLDTQSGITQVGTFEQIHTSAITQTTSFTPATTGEYNIGFHATSPSENSFLFLFGYTVDVSLATPQVNANALKVYPNPVSNVLTIENASAIDTVEIYNMIGQKVAQHAGASSQLNLNVSTLSAGNYIVKITSANQVKTMKIVKN